MAETLAVTRSGDTAMSSSLANMLNGGMQHSVYINEECMPIAPAKITITIANKNRSIDLAAGGVYKVLNMPGLTSYEFELIIPHDQYSCPFAIYDNGYQPPQHYFDLFEKLKTDSTVENRAFPFVVVDNSDSPTLISTICTLEDYEISQDADEDILDYRVNLRLEKYERHVTQSFSLQQNADGSWTAVDDGMHDRLQAAADAVNAAQTAVNMAQGAADLMASLKTKNSGTMSAVTTELLGTGATVADVKRVAFSNGLTVVTTVPAGRLIKL